jgi:cytochrome c oxidase subunit 3
LSDSHSTAVARHPQLQHHFDDMEQQREAASVGMWVFLATEVMFFGGFFLAYLIYRWRYFDAFAAGSNSQSIWLGSINTGVLICSSLTMALAVHAAAVGKRKLLVLFLVATMILGGAFLSIKFYEYYEHYQRSEIPGPNFHFEFQPGEPQAPQGNVQLFFSLYFGMTGLHASHMIVGEGLLLWLVIMAWKGRFTPEWHTPVENIGLYWHFVDIIWIYLFPLLYLINRHQLVHH